MTGNVIQISKGRCGKSLWHAGPFMVDESTGTVECGACNKTLSPIAVLKYLSNKESQLNTRFFHLSEKLNKLESKPIVTGKP